MNRMVPLLRVLLCLYLLFWEPLNVATELLQAWPTLDARGGWAVAELIFHGVVATLAVAGGIALWIRSPHGPILAMLGLYASLGRSMQVARYSWLPHNLTPGMADVLAFVSVGHVLLWTAFLVRYQDRLIEGRVPEHLRLE